MSPNLALNISIILFYMIYIHFYVYFQICKIFIRVGAHLEVQRRLGFLKKLVCVCECVCGHITIYVTWQVNLIWFSVKTALHYVEIREKKQCLGVDILEFIFFILQQFSSHAIGYLFFNHENSFLVRSPLISVRPHSILK